MLALHPGMLRLHVVLYALLLGAPALAAELENATQRLGQLEADADQLRAGDRVTANALVLDVNAVRTQLGRIRERDAEWKAQVDRSTALIERIRARGFAAPTGEAPPPGARVAMSSVDRHYFDEFDKIARRYEDELAAIDPIRAIDKTSLNGGANEMRSALSRVVDQQHPEVVAAKARIERFEAQRAEKVAAGKKAAEEKAAAFAAEASDVGTQLDQLSAVFGPKFNCKLSRPFTPGRVTEWLEQMRQYQKLREKGVATLDRLATDHPAFVRDDRLVHLKVYFERYLGQELDGCLGELVSEQPASNGGRYGDLFQLIERGNWAINNHAPHAVYADLVKALHDGAEGAEALATYRKVWLGEKDTKSPALAQRFRAYVDTLASRAKAALAAQRMPEARSTDRSLLDVAAGAVKNGGYGPWERMVINAALEHVSTTSTDTREQGDYLVVTTYPRVYDEFQVCTAEKHGEVYRLVYYTVRKYSRGGSVTPIGRWLIADRIVSSQILAENISK